MYETDYCVEDLIKSQHLSDTKIRTLSSIWKTFSVRKKTFYPINWGGSCAFLIRLICFQKCCSNTVAHLPIEVTVSFYKIFIPDLTFLNRNKLSVACAANGIRREQRFYFETYASIGYGKERKRITTNWNSFIVRSVTKLAWTTDFIS